MNLNNRIKNKMNSQTESKVYNFKFDSSKDQS